MHNKNIMVMLVLILIDVQYLQNAVFSFEKGSSCQYHSTSGVQPNMQILLIENLSLNQTLLTFLLPVRQTWITKLILAVFL